MEKTRIFITGMGAVTPVGIGVPAYWQGINEGKCGIVEKETIERIDYDLLEKITYRITHEVKHVNRVLFDVTPKPTGTIEWE